MNNKANNQNLSEKSATRSSDPKELVLAGKTPGPHKVRGAYNKHADQSTTLEVVNEPTGEVIWSGIYYQANYFAESLNVAHNRAEREALATAIDLLEETRNKIDDSELAPHIFDIVVDGDKTIADKVNAGQIEEVKELVNSL